MTVGGQLTAWLAGGELSDKKLRKLVAELVDIAEQACRLGLQLEQELAESQKLAALRGSLYRNAESARKRAEEKEQAALREARQLRTEVERLREPSNGQQERLVQSFVEDPPTVQQVMAEAAETHLAGRAELVQNMVGLFRETLRGDVQ